MDIAVTCCYYNPCGYRSRRVNFDRFYHSMRSAGVPLLTVQLCFGEAEPDLSSYDGLLTLRGGDVLWQKERLIAVGIDELIRRGADAVLWLDADVMVLDREWMQQCRESLRRAAVCQLFAKVYREDSFGQMNLGTRSLASIYSARGFVRPRLGAPGIAWGARASVLRQIKPYDACIVGGGDVAWIMACMRTAASPYWFQALRRCGFFRHLKPNARKHYISWAVKADAIIGGELGYVESDLGTMYHGKWKNRRHGQRHLLLSDFDPRTDVAVSESGAWRWATDKPSLHDEIRAYFQSRSEDE